MTREPDAPPGWPSQGALRTSGGPGPPTRWWRCLGSLAQAPLAHFARARGAAAMERADAGTTHFW
eukprot:2089699-Pyramimonas_sp.AAC.1